MERLKYGTGKLMTDEQKRIHKREIQKRWRSAHKDFVKAQNKHFSELYAITKPYECFCAVCGKKFKASRNSVKKCPDCVAERKRLIEMRNRASVLKKEARKEEYSRIVRMYRQGVKQQAIADVLGRSQSGISAIIRKMNKRRIK